MVAVEGNRFIVQSLCSSMMTTMMRKKHLESTSRMAPTVQPPSSSEDSSPAPDTTASLRNTVQKLCDLVWEIAMPKTKTAKTVSITMEMLLLACELAGSACTLLWDPHEDPRVDNIGRQLEDIKAHLGIPSKVGTPQKLSYTMTLATGLRSSVPTLSLPLPPPPCPWPHAAG